MFNLDAKSLRLIGELTKDVNGLKKFLNLSEMAPAMFQAFETANPPNLGELKPVIFLQSINGELYVSGVMLNSDAKPTRALFQWHFKTVLARLDLEKVLDLKDELASGQMSWAQICGTLKIKK